MSKQFIGKQFTARIPLYLPTGTVEPGDAFEFTAELSAYGLSPDLWLATGQAEMSEEPAPVAPVTDVALDAVKPYEHPPFVGTGRRHGNTRP